MILIAALVVMTDFNTYHKPQAFVKLSTAVTLTDFERKPIIEKVVHEQIKWCPANEHLHVSNLTDDGTTLTVVGDCIKDDQDKELHSR